VERIPGAVMHTLVGADMAPYGGDTAALVDVISRFVDAHRREVEEFDRVVTTVLFTDIVSSTAQAARIGDVAWKELVQRHHSVVRAMLGRYRGIEVDTAGDGFFATFDGPGRAVRCAHAIIAAMRPLDLGIRTGIHTGEVEVGPQKIHGLAVHIGARVAALAGESEVVVSSTVRDLVAGSGLQFADHGEHTLKGVPGTWRLYRALAPQSGVGITA
jgi:class 3 adenylate cyclase